MRRSATIVIALLLLGATAQGASQKDRTECDSEDGGDFAIAETHWQSVETIDTAAAYQDHIDRFPSCPFATLAKLRIEALKKNP
jgi:hypothetical protein